MKHQAALVCCSDLLGSEQGGFGRHQQPGPQRLARHQSDRRYWQRGGKPANRAGGHHATRYNAGAGPAAATRSASRPSRGWMERGSGLGPPLGCGSEAMRARQGGGDPSDRNCSTQQPRQRCGGGNHHPSIARLPNDPALNCERQALLLRMLSLHQARGSRCSQRMLLGAFPARGTEPLHPSAWRRSAAAAPC